MSDLTAFLLARIAEEVAAAQACAEVFPPPWDVNDRGHSAMVRADAPNFWPVSQIDQEQETPGRWPGEHLDHIARHDPARVLAECAARRKIVDLCAQSASYIFDDDPDDPIEWWSAEVHMAADTLRALASVYADHPGFREEWQ